MKTRFALMMIPVLALLSGCGDDESATTAADNTAYITDFRPPAKRVATAATDSRVQETATAPVRRSTGAAAASYTGRVLYRSTRTSVPGVTVQVVQAKDDGKPTDEVLGTTRADEHGHFTVALTQPTDEKVALVVSAVRVSAESGGDHTQEGYEVKSELTTLGVLPFPDPSKPNTLLIDRRNPGRPSSGN